MNRTIFQYFQWYNTPEQNLWKQVAKEARHLAELGVTDVWLPPAYKSANGIEEPGYAVYDLYDLGEFDQKGTVRTRYGTKEEYLQAIRSLHEAGLQVLADVVLNHRMGGDEKETINTVGVKADNREEATGKPQQIEAYTRFTFPGRKGRYSDYVWDQHSFSGLQEDDEIKLILNEHTQGEWDDMPSDENGNYDYLLGVNVNFRNPQVREELKRWGAWYVETTGVDGFRLDGLKHIGTSFFPEWLDFMRNHFQKDFTVIGEFWKQDAAMLSEFIELTENRTALFDVPLHFNFHEAAQKKEAYDMRNILSNTLVQLRPDKAITFVDNHDTQPLQALESFVDSWFKPLAGAIISLRQEGIPCVSYPALYGAHYTDKREGGNVEVILDKVGLLPQILGARKHLAYGSQRDYFDHENIVGWTREGTPEMPGSGLAVLMTNAGAGTKQMSLGKVNAGRTFVNVASKQPAPITLNEQGEGVFKVDATTVAIYADERIAKRLLQ